MIRRYFLIGLGFGIFYETLIVKTSIYENIIKKSTLKRLGKYGYIQRQREYKIICCWIEKRDQRKALKGVQIDHVI